MTALAPPGDRLDFDLPPALEANEPPEARGLKRDGVRLLVGWRSRRDVSHTVFRRLADHLRDGDLLVVNTSATIPAAVTGVLQDGSPVELRFSTRLQAGLRFPTRLPAGLRFPTRLPAGLWVVELRRPAVPASVPYTEGRAGMAVMLPGRAGADLLVPYGTPGRLWVARVWLPGRFDRWLAEHGSPIRYRYVPLAWPLACYQTVFATEPGSAEMPSAARPFSAELVTEVVSRGVAIAPVLLHTGVSSPEVHELPYPEYYQVPSSTADLVNHTRQRGGRIIAVGTTVVRALETVADDRGAAHPGRGWTETVINPERGVRVIDGLITGWHEPAASHLAMLEAIAGRTLLELSYREALANGYRWHEFGDSHLILP